MTTHKKLIIANWKMNPASLSEAKQLYKKITASVRKHKDAACVVCVPFVYVGELQKNQKGQGAALGAQDVFYEKKGAYTGEISTLMLKDLKVSHVIVGHSERRAMGETSEIVSRKVATALKEKLTVILCVGEKERDEANYLHVLKEQVLASLCDVPKSAFSNLLIAYEPVWAVGAGAHADSASDTEETILYIKKVLIEAFGRKYAEQVKLLYGGSVDRKNAGEFLAREHIDGLLLGRASLDATSFGEILKLAHNSIV